LQGGLTLACFYCVGSSQGGLTLACLWAGLAAHRYTCTIIYKTFCCICFTYSFWPKQGSTSVLHRFAWLEAYPITCCNGLQKCETVSYRADRVCQSDDNSREAQRRGNFAQLGSDGGLIYIYIYIYIYIISYNLCIGLPICLLWSAGLCFRES